MMSDLDPRFHQLRQSVADLADAVLGCRSLMNTLDRVPGTGAHLDALERLTEELLGMLEAQAHELGVVAGPSGDLDAIRDAHSV